MKKVSVFVQSKQHQVMVQIIQADPGFTEAAFVAPKAVVKNTKESNEGLLVGVHID